MAKSIILFTSEWMEMKSMYEDKRINWYPGHMAKALRLLTEQLRRVDFVMELCDARLPHSSRNPDLNRLVKDKPKILIMNKADLADPGLNDLWLKSFRNEGLDTMLLTAKKIRKAEILQHIYKATETVRARAMQKGFNKTIRGMVIGVPNVGKSTLINSLSGTASAKTGDKPGVTKSNQWIRIDPYIELMDTPGLLWPRMDDQKAALKLGWLGTIGENAVDMDHLAMSFLDEISSVAPNALVERMHIDHPDLKGVDLLDAVCAGRGWLIKGGVSDYDRCFHVVLDEFRSGKLGRMTLEAP